MAKQSWEELGLRHTKLQQRHTLTKQPPLCPECGETLLRFTGRKAGLLLSCPVGRREYDNVRYKRAWKMVPWLIEPLDTLAGQERHDYIQAFRVWTIRAGNRYIMDTVAEHLTEEEL